MAKVSTIYLTSKVAPSGQDWDKGFITRHDATGVTISDRDDHRGQSRFYPMHMIQRIEHNTGW